MSQPINALGRIFSVRQIFWGFFVVHMFLWTLAPTLICPNAPLDVIEGYAWGHEWLMGTYKHPPMQAWWLEIFEYVTFRATWGHFLASQLAIGGAFWAVWKTGLRIVSARAALVGVVLLEGIIYYNFTSPEFNPNVLQICFWALIGHSYLNAIKDNKAIDWTLLGLWSACGLYSKYSTVLLLGSLLILTLVRPESRRKFRSIGPYFAVCVATVLFLPHVLWLQQNNFPSFSYAQERMQSDHVGILKSTVLIPMLFLGSQILAMLPAILMWLTLLERPKPAPKQDLKKFDKAFLATVSFGPCILVLIARILFGLNIHDMWAMPFWNFIGLWALATFRLPLSESALQRFSYSFLIIAFGILAGYVGSVYFYPYISGKAQRINFPGHLLAKKVDDAWRGRYTKPVQYIIGDTWPAGNIAYYAPQRPHVFIHGDTAISPWINPEDVKRQGAIIVWCIQYCGYGNYFQDMPDFVHN
jgi:hypothetical protein